MKSTMWECFSMWNGGNKVYNDSAQAVVIPLPDCMTVSTFLNFYEVLIPHKMWELKLQIVLKTTLKDNLPMAK